MAASSRLSCHGGSYTDSETSQFAHECRDRAGWQLRVELVSLPRGRRQRAEVQNRPRPIGVDLPQSPPTEIISGRFRAGAIVQRHDDKAVPLGTHEASIGEAWT